jgi:transcriptional regulator with XRE-family HTH domain
MVARRQLYRYTVFMAGLLDEIRRAVETSGKTRYRIAKESGVSAGQLSRLVNGERGMTVETIERLAEYLGLKISIQPKNKTKKER